MRIEGAGEVVRLLVLLATGVYIGLSCTIWYFYWRLFSKRRVVWRNLRYVTGMAGSAVLMSVAVELSVISRIINEHPPLTAGVIALLVAWSLGCTSLVPLLRDLRNRWIHADALGSFGGPGEPGTRGGGRGGQGGQGGSGGTGGPGEPGGPGGRGGPSATGQAGGAGGKGGAGGSRKENS